MATEKQIEANRRNAQQSTGPRTAEGKAAARRNALSSGIYAEREVILPAENAQDLAALTAEYHQRYQPATPEERCLVDCLIGDEWLLRRFRTIEAQLMTRAIRSTSYPEEHTPLGHAYARAETQLERLQRRINATRRSYLQTLKGLQALQAQNAPHPDALADPQTDPEAAPDRIPPAMENQPLTPAIGFVPSPRETAFTGSRYSAPVRPSKALRGPGGLSR